MGIASLVGINGSKGGIAAFMDGSLFLFLS